MKMAKEVASSFARGEQSDRVVLARSLSDVDAPELFSISEALLAAFPDDFRRMGVSPESAHSFVTQSFRAHNGMLSLWIDGELAATSGYSLSGTAYFVTNVWTAEEFRGLGIARFMVSEAEKEIASKGATEARLWCDRSLSRAYETMGYEPETRDHRVSRDHVVDVLVKKSIA